jgi:hypothetical protein
MAQHPRSPAHGDNPSRFQDQTGPGPDHAGPGPDQSGPDRTGSDQGRDAGPGADHSSARADGGGGTGRSGETPTQQSQALQFPLLTETAHSAEFILSEGNGSISRDAAYLAHPATTKIGQPLKFTAPATATVPATYVPAAVGADCDALAIYAGTSTDPVAGLRIAVITRNAEVNGKLIAWGAITVPEQALGIARLATHGIIVR